ncbi:MAG: FtsX-like permease family protein [Acidobacteriaceae bacterium]
MNSNSGTLAWGTAWKIAWRDLHASWAKFTFVIVAVALGVGSLTGMRSFSVVFQRTLLEQARTIMAADLSARDFHLFSPDQLAQLQKLRADGVESTLVTETVSMASTSANPDPLLVSLKVVDPAQYPYYGHVQLASGRSLRDVVKNNTAIVSEEFLLRERSHVGDTLHLGNSQFRIVDVVRSEPDRISSSFGIGPRVMITQAALPATGLVRPGSRASERMLFRLSPAVSASSSGMDIDELRKRVEHILPEAQVTDFREANPALVNGLNRATAMLTLVSLVTMVLSAIGVAMAMHAHLQQRLETIAVMKALGARSSQVMRIYLLQTLFLGTAGALLGIAAGSAVARAFPVLLERLISLPVEGHLAFAPVLIGLLTGVLTTLLFTLPPLLEIRGFRPLHILRRNVEEGQMPGLGRLLPRDRVQVIAIVIILVGLAVVASTLTQSAMVGEWFAGGLLAVLVFLLLAASGVLLVLRWAMQRFRARFSPTARQGLANLYRPGNQSAAVLTALGVGVMLIMTVYSMQHAIVRDLNQTGSRKIPNVFLVDITTEEMPGLQKLVEAQPAVHGGFESIPIVSARIASINGVPTDKLKIQHYPKRMLRSTSVTWADALPIGEKVVSGHWWTTNSATPQVAVSEGTARRLHLSPGSTIVFQSGGENIAATVAALYRSDGQHAYSRSRFILPSRVLAGLPVVWYGAFHADPSRVGDVERALFAAYPTVTVINVADVLEVVRKVVDQIALIIRFLAGFAMLAGGIILASSVTATRFQRVREVAILKSLGALRRQIVSVLSIEFLMLGGIAGAAGVIFSLALSSILLHKLDVGFHPGWGMAVAAVFATAILSAATGWMASLRILQQKPLEVLREE